MTPLLLALALDTTAPVAEVPPPNANALSLRAMVANRDDLTRGVAAPAPKADIAAAAVKALLDGKPKSLLDASNGTPMAGGGNSGDSNSGSSNGKP